MATYTAKQYAALLNNVGLELDRRLRPTMSRAAGNIKRDWRDRAAAKNPTHAPKYAGSIIMRRAVVDQGGYTVTVEPRFGRSGQGPLGSVLEKGGRHSAAQQSNVEALEKELPTLLEYLAKYAADAIR